MNSVTVQVINDSLSEGSEEFNLILDVPSSLGPAITAGGRNTAVGVITDSTGENVDVRYNTYERWAVENFDRFGISQPIFQSFFHQQFTT